MIFVIVNQSSKKEFNLPKFESSKLYGAPKVPSEYQWEIISTNNFCVGLSSNVYLKGNKINTYFSNPAENDVWLKLRLIDEKGQIHAETGIIKEGEFIESIYLENKESIVGQLDFKVMAYEPETYYSAGSVIINPKIVQAN